MTVPVGDGRLVRSQGQGRPEARRRSILGVPRALLVSLSHSFREAVASLERERRRLLPMALGIVWGMAAVMVLLALASGFEESQRRILGAYGDRFVLVRLNRAELDRAAGGKEPRLRMDAYDLERLRLGAPAIKRMSPLNMAYRVRITARHGAGSNVYVAGALPEIAQIRNMPLAEGRFFNELDEADRRRVIVLGPLVRQQLFGRGPAIGRTVRIAGFSTGAIPSPGSAAAGASRSSGSPGSSGSSRSSRSSRSFGSSSSSISSPQRDARRPADTGARRGPGPGGVAPAPASAAPSSGGDRAAQRLDREVNMSGELFLVIGVLADVEIQRESYVSVARTAFVPFSTSCAVFDLDYSTMMIEPVSPDARDQALEQFRQVMGARYKFAPSDRNAVPVYFDAIERARAIDAVFGGLRLFLSVVGALILAVGAIGVMNVVLVSVAARRFEIGLRKALGATPLVIYMQFFLETILGCFLSGTVGFLLGGGAIGLIALLPLPQGFSRPLLDLRTAAEAFGLLAGIAVVVGLYPARRAALLPPVAALRGGG